MAAALYSAILPVIAALLLYLTSDRRCGTLYYFPPVIVANYLCSASFVWRFVGDDQMNDSKARQVLQTVHKIAIQRHTQEILPVNTNLTMKTK